VARRDGGGMAFALVAVCPCEVPVGLEMASYEVGSGGSWLGGQSRGPHASFWSLRGRSAVLGGCRSGRTRIWPQVGGRGAGHRPGVRGGASRAGAVALWHSGRHWVAAVTL
jgi:hypothetical protein